MATAPQSQSSFDLGQIPLVVRAVGDAASINKFRAAIPEGVWFQFVCLQNSSVEPPALKFKRLAAEWRHAIRYSSSFRRNIMQRAYWSIIKMDRAALPFIFEDMKGPRGAEWVFALHVITEQSFGEPESTFEQIREAWFKWGRENGYIAA